MTANKHYLSSLIVLSALFLSACGSTHNWTKIDPNMPAAFKEKHEELISKSKADFKKDPNDVDAVFQLAYSYQQIGEYGKAEDAYLKVLVLDPGHVPALNNLADIYEQMEEYKLSAEYIVKLQELEPTSSEALSDAIRILLKANLPTQAKDVLTNFALHQTNNTPEMGQFISDKFNEIAKYKSTPSDK